MKKILLIAFLFLSVKLFAQAPTGVPAWNPQNVSYRDTSTNLYWFSLGNSLWWRPLQLGDIGPLIAAINSPAFLGTPTTPLISLSDSSFKIINSAWIKEYAALHTTYFNHNQFINAGDVLHPISLVDSIPTQGGNSGKVLGTNGTNLLWVTGGGGAWGTITGTLSAQTDLQTALNGKQATLVSGTNIKTINSGTLLGSGDIPLISNQNSTAQTGNFILKGTGVFKDNVSTGRLSVTIDSTKVLINQGGNVLTLNNNIAFLNGTGQGGLLTPVVSSYTAAKHSGNITTYSITYPNDTTGVSNTVIAGNNPIFYNNTVSDGVKFAVQKTAANTPSFLINDGAGLELLRITADNNTNFFAGYQAALNNVVSGSSGKNNVAIGYQPLYSNTLGEEMIAIGTGALFANTSGLFNTAIGYHSLFANTSGSYNIAIGGLSALIANTTGHDNLAIGTNALLANTSGFNNIALLASLQSNTNGTFNVALGGTTLQQNISGGFNMGIGSGALNQNTTGSYSVGIGTGAGASATTGSFNVSIGSYSDMPNITASGQLNIGNVLYGLNLYQTASNSSTPTTTGSIGIGVTTPTSRFDLPSSTTGRASMRILSGVTPATTNDGDFYNSTSTHHLYVNLNGTFYQLDQQAGGGGSGTVTNVATGYGLSGGPITTTGTLIADTSSTTGLVAKPRYNTDYSNLSGRITTNTTNIATNTTNIAAKEGLLTLTATKTANYTLSPYDIAVGDVTSGTFTFTLPNAPADGTLDEVKMNGQTGTNTISLAVQGVDVFNGGGTTASLVQNFQAITFKYKLSNHTWYSTSTNLALGLLDTRYASIATTINGKPLSSNITLGLASADFANQGTTTGVLHGNAAGNPSFGSVVNADIAASTIDLTAKVTGLLPDGNISSATNWNTAYTNRITSLTTTGSGAATLSGNVLNIPTPSGLTNPMTTTGDIIYSSSGSTPARLAIGATGNPLTVIGGLPAYSNLVLTNPASAATFTLAAGKTLTNNNTLTLTATDGSTLAIGGGGTLGSNAFTSTAYAPIASPTFTGVVTMPTPFTLGAVSVTSTGTQLNYLSGANGVTGTNNVVLNASPSLTTPTINTSGTNNNFSLNTGSSPFAATASVNYQLNGSTNVLYRVGFYGNTSATLAASNSYANIIMAGSAGATTTTSGTSAMLTNLGIGPPAFVLGTGSTTTWATTVDIDGPASTSGAGTLTNPVLSLLVRTGNSKFGGGVILQGYTVAGLPTAITGMTAYVTDATTPTFGSIAVGGGAVFAHVIYNGTNWITE